VRASPQRNGVGSAGGRPGGPREGLGWGGSRVKWPVRLWEGTYLEKYGRNQVYVVSKSPLFRIPLLLREEGDRDREKPSVPPGRCCKPTT